jgi:cyclic pyranopterin phosphate synthase
MFTDNLKRATDYLRISVTDRCNLRCVYCIPKQGIVVRPREGLLTFEEILRLVKIFTFLGIKRIRLTGIKRIRLTGGEPLIRKGIVNLVQSLAKIENIEDISLTTNAILLSFYAERLKQAGVKRINISLDTLQQEKFAKITGNNFFSQVLEGIDKAKSIGFYPLKLNMVVMKGINEDEIIDFVNFSLSKGLILRFIEFMRVTPLWREDYFIPIEEVKRICERKFRLDKIENSGPGPAIYYRSREGGILGFIKTSENNCRHCSRLRLSSTGQLKVCLYETGGFGLRYLLRTTTSDWEIRDSIKQRINMKFNVDYRNYESSQLYMCNVGG